MQILKGVKHLGSPDQHLLFTKELFAAAKDKKGELLWPLRVALSGEEKSPSPFEIAWTIGKSETLDRIEASLDMLNN